jgi:hypothetical protein
LGPIATVNFHDGRDNLLTDSDLSDQLLARGVETALTLLNDRA